MVVASYARWGMAQAQGEQKKRLRINHDSTRCCLCELQPRCRDEKGTKALVNLVTYTNRNRHHFAYHKPPSRSTTTVAMSHF